MSDTTNKQLPTIVYVEDNKGDAVLLEEAQRERGHAVELVIIDNGDKALHYFEVKDRAGDLPPPHCVLLDSLLPLVTGAQLIAFLRNSTVFTDTPVYIFAAEAEYQVILKTAKVSRESILTKPGKWEEFLALADLLMKSAEAKADGTAASSVDDHPETHAEGELRGQHPEHSRR